MAHAEQSNSADKPNTLRVLFDTNVLISYLLISNPQSTITSIVDAAFEGRYILLAPGALLVELTDTVKARRHLARRLNPEQAQEFAELLMSIAEPVPQIDEQIPALTRDPKDDYLLAYALLGRADYLVTGDDDLLVLREVEGVKILRPAEFKQLLEI